jgi:hypothetical protein
MEKNELRPFHETIVDFIDYCPLPSYLNRELICLLYLIQRTKIPANWDRIMEAIDKKYCQCQKDPESDSMWYVEYLKNVKEGLLRQKREAEEKKAREANEF